MRTVRMARELDLLPLIQHEHLLELPPDILQHLLRLIGAPPFASRCVALAPPRHAPPHALGPEPDAIEAAADVHYDTHDLAVIGPFEGLTNGGEHDVQPEGVDGCGAAFEAVGPFAAVFVLGVFPFGTHAALEEVVVRFEGQFGGGGDVILCDSEGQIGGYDWRGGGLKEVWVHT